MSDGAAVGFVLSDLDGRIVQADGGLAAILGVPVAVIVGRSWRDFTHPDDRGRSAEEIGRLLRGETREFSLQKRYVQGGGATVWARVSVSLLRGGDGLPRQLIGIVEDITAKREVVEALRETRERYATLVAMLPVGVYTCDAEGRITFFNPQAAALWGREPALGDSEERFCGSFRLWRADGAPLPHARTPMAAAVATGESCRSSPVTIERPDGSRIDVLVNIDPIRDGSGAIAGAVNVFSDVSAQRRAEEALRESERRFRTLAEAMPQIVWTSCPDGSVDYFNRRWEEYTGLGAEAAHGWTWRAVLSQEDQGETMHAWTRSLTTGEPFQVEHRIRRHDGEERWHLSRAIPMRNDAGRITRWFGTSTDIHEHRVAEQDLRRHRERLEEIVGARTAELERSHHQLRLSERMAALGTLSLGLGHDMGNLLLPIRARLDVLHARRDLPEDVRKSLESMRTCAEYLQNLSRGLRLFALDPEDDQASPAATDLGVWSREAIPFFRNALGRQIVFDHDLPADLPPPAVSPHRLTQALLNLVTNARDALGPRGGGRVVLRAALVPEGGVRIEIADDGPGMPEEVRRRCTEPFFTTRTRGVSTGLGLALVHGIVRRAGGGIEIESAPGRGTVVRLTFPAAAAGDITAGPVADAVVSLEDARTRAIVFALLRTMRVEGRAGDGPHQGASVWITSASPEQLAAARSFLCVGGARTVIALGAPDPAWAALGAKVVRTPLAPAELRDLLRSVLGERTAAEAIRR